MSMVAAILTEQQRKELYDAQIEQIVEQGLMKYIYLCNRWTVAMKYRELMRLAGANRKMRDAIYYLYDQAKESI